MEPFPADFSMIFKNRFDSKAQGMAGGDRAYTNGGSCNLATRPLPLPIFPDCCNRV
jgi:hypothetical protein